MKKLERYFGGDLQVLMVGNAFESAMRFGAFVIYSQVLGPDDLGIVAAVTAVVYLLTDLTSFGIDASVISLGSKELGGGDRDRLVRLTHSGLWLHAIFGILLAGIGCLVASSVADAWLGDPTLTGALVVAFAGSLFLRLSEYALSILRTYQRFRFHAMAGLAAAAVALAGAVYLRVTDQVGVFSVLALVLFLAPLVKLVAGLAGTPFEFLKLRGPRASLMREVLDFGKWIWATNLLETGVRRVNILLLQALAGNAVTGQFHVAARYAEFLSLIFQPLRKYLLPKFTALKKRAEIARMLRRTYALLAWTLLLIPAAWILAGPVITFAQGEEYRAAVALFRIVVVARLVFLLTKPMTFVLLSLDRPRVQTWMHLLGAAIYLACALVLIPTHGAVGSAFSLVAFSVTVFISLAWYLMRDRARSASHG